MGVPQATLSWVQRRFPDCPAPSVVLQEKIKVGYHLLYEAAILSSAMMTTREVHMACRIYLHLGKGKQRHDDI